MRILAPTLSGGRPSGPKELGRTQSWRGQNEIAPKILTADLERPRVCVSGLASRSEQLAGTNRGAEATLSRVARHKYLEATVAIGPAWQSNEDVAV